MNDSISCGYPWVVLLLDAKQIVGQLGKVA